jgi:hypothetical protein
LALTGSRKPEKKKKNEDRKFNQQTNQELVFRLQKIGQTTRKQEIIIYIYRNNLTLNNSEIILPATFLIFQEQREIVHST